MSPFSGEGGAGTWPVPPLPRTRRLRLGLERLVAAGAVAGGDLGAAEAQVDAELAAVVVPMVEQQAAQERRPRQRQERAALDHHLEGLSHPAVVQRRQILADERCTL